MLNLIYKKKIAIYFDHYMYKQIKDCGKKQFHRQIESCGTLHETEVSLIMLSQQAPDELDYDYY